MRSNWAIHTGILMLAGALAPALLAPPASAQRREYVELQQAISQLQQQQQAFQTAMAGAAAVNKTLLEQTLDSIAKLSVTVAELQKTVRDMQAVSGARLDSMSTQVQSVSDNLQEMMMRLGRLNQQLTDAQNALQSIDAKLASGAPALAATPPPAGAPGPAAASAPPAAAAAAPPVSAPPSADLLYSNGLRDLNSRKYDLAAQEFQDYLKFYPDTDLASNAQFYLGEIHFAQEQYQQAVEAYSRVIDNYPRSFKLAPAHLKRGLALVSLGQRDQGIRDLQSVVRLYPGTDEERRARTKLRELGVES